MDWGSVYLLKPVLVHFSASNIMEKELCPKDTVLIWDIDGLGSNTLQTTLVVQERL